MLLINTSLHQFSQLSDLTTYPGASFCPGTFVLISVVKHIYAVAQLFHLSKPARSLRPRWLQKAQEISIGSDHFLPLVLHRRFVLYCQYLPSMCHLVSFRCLPPASDPRHPSASAHQERIPFRRRLLVCPLL